ncbi:MULTISPECIES: hypothetical protein [Arthrobacter]|uniref:CdaR family transcriptional regulator n=2 Tax=Arthrobacter TaxID=1663 RepID=A0ABU9KGZ3_9MICC|nr:hypothetical protein [Arthrobacter sp. YJM1]MDP5226145.1 hypothetical protein [Arthrobacter sp. YJM1]
MCAPVPADSLATKAIILDQEDIDADVSGSVVCLVGIRGREALPTARRLAPRKPVALVLKGTSDEVPEIEELLRPAGVGLFLIEPASGWEFVLAVINGRIQTTDYHSDVRALIEEDLFAIAQTTARMTSSHVVIEDAANKVLAYSTVSNDIDELRRASILTRSMVLVPARLEDGLRERAAIASSQVNGFWAISGSRRPAPGSRRTWGVSCSARPAGPRTN